MRGQIHHRPEGPSNAPVAAAGRPLQPERYTPMKASQRPFACRKARALLRLYRNALPELLGEPDEQSFGAADVAEPIRVLVLDHVANELRAARAEPGERLVDVVHGEHDA